MYYFVVRSTNAGSTYDGVHNLDTMCFFKNRKSANYNRLTVLLAYEPKIMTIHKFCSLQK